MDRTILVAPPQTPRDPAELPGTVSDGDPAGWVRTAPARPAAADGSPVRPGHYRLRGVECIDVIRAMLTPEEYRGFLKGNVIKYDFRAGHKGPAEVDYDKALWYQRELHAAAAEAREDRT